MRCPTGTVVLLEVYYFEELKLRESEVLKFFIKKGKRLMGKNSQYNIRFLLPNSVMESPRKLVTKTVSLRLRRWRKCFLVTTKVRDSSVGLSYKFYRGP